MSRLRSITRLLINRYTAPLAELLGKDSVMTSACRTGWACGKQSPAFNECVGSGPGDGEGFPCAAEPLSGRSPDDGGEPTPHDRGPGHPVGSEGGLQSLHTSRKRTEGPS